MSAHIVYDTAPLGALIRYSDGAPRPPARFAKKLAAWERRNGLGRLVRKEPPRDRPVRILLPVGDNLEFLHLADSREAAELWLAKHRHGQARIEDVTADEIGADVVEGRAAA